MIYYRLYSLIFVPLIVACTLNAHAAGLEDKVIQSGPNAGKKLIDVIRAYRVDGLAIPERAIEDSVHFFDQYRDTYHTVHHFAQIPDGKYTAAGPEETLKNQKTIANQRYLVIFDQDAHSSKKSFHLIDLETGEIKSTEAARGRDSFAGSGPKANHDPACKGKKPGYACHFESHTNDSSASPLGFFSTGHIYRHSNNGHPRDIIELDGLEKPTIGGFEGNDVATTVVIHPAPYVYSGHAGRSHGCPALNQQVFDRLKDKLKGGVLFYFYSHELDSLNRKVDLSGLESPVPAIAVTERTVKSQASQPAHGDNNASGEATSGNLR
jgi:hypothetical protein